MFSKDSIWLKVLVVAWGSLFGCLSEVSAAESVTLYSGDPISLIENGAPKDYRTSVVPSSSSFTISMLFKVNGPGPLEGGQSSWSNGMLVSAGSGWNDGFRVMCYDQANLLPAFEVGRNEGSLGMTSPEGLVKEVWHHLAVTLSEDHVGRIYIDGSLFVKREEMPTPIFKGEPIRLGYVGYGVGSLDLEIAAAEYYPCALTESEVVQSLLAMINGRGKEFDGIRGEVTPDLKALIKEQIPDPEPEVAPIPAPARSMDRSGWERIEFAPGEGDDAERLQKLIDDENTKSASGRRIEVAFAPGRYRFASSVRLSDAKNRWAFVSRDRRTRAELSGGVIVPASAFAAEQDGSGRVSAAVDVPRPRPYCVGTNPQFGVIPFSGDDKVLPMSVWPNDGYMKTAFSESDRTMRPEGIPVAAGKEFLAHGYWKFDWADGGLQCQSEENGVVRTTSESQYGFTSPVRVQFENAREFADRPGEWAIEGGHFIMMPPEGGLKDVTLPRLETPFFVVEGADAPVFEGLSFVSCCSDALVMRRLSGARVDDCRFFAVGGTAVVAEDCNESSITWSSVSHTGYDGMKLSAGSRETLTLGNSSVANCSFSDIGLLARTYTPAVLLRGCGCRVCSCTVRRVPSSAFRIEGNEHRVCHCFVEEVVLESDDQGATDSYGDPSFRACHYAYNVFRRIGGDGVAATGRGGIRLDDMISGMYVYGNRFIEASRGNFGGVQIHGGQHNRVVGNIFEDCAIAFSFNPWGRERWLQQLDNTTPGEKNKGYAETELYRERYPELKGLRDDVDVNYVIGNILIRCGKRYNNKPGSVTAYGNRSISEGSWEGLAPVDGKGVKVTGRTELRTIGETQVFSVEVEDCKSGVNYTAFVSDELSNNPFDWYAEERSVIPIDDGRLVLDLVRDSSPSKFAKIVETPYVVGIGSRLSDVLQ